ncbi:MAG: hypothetical protein K8S55_06280 [Phycisphaerae bacterium]|nr:hypothetical protein [Phycisphaerae bacterium]
MNVTLQAPFNKHCLNKSTISVSVSKNLRGRYADRLTYLPWVSSKQQTAQLYLKFRIFKIVFQVFFAFPAIAYNYTKGQQDVASQAGTATGDSYTAGVWKEVEITWDTTAGQYYVYCDGTEETSGTVERCKF